MSDRKQPRRTGDPMTLDLTERRTIKVLWEAMGYMVFDTLRPQLSTDELEHAKAVCDSLRVAMLRSVERNDQNIWRMIEANPSIAYEDEIIAYDILAEEAADGGDDVDS